MSLEFLEYNALPQREEDDGAPTDDVFGNAYSCTTDLRQGLFHTCSFGELYFKSFIMLYTYAVRSIRLMPLSIDAKNVADNEMYVLQDTPMKRMCTWCIDRIREMLL
ncbi:hypothetical protein AKJ16_DCAP24942 [Drosera capensis]